MSVNLATLAQNAAGNGIVDLVDTGTLNPNGYVEFRTGTKPASPQAAVSGLLLATLGYSNPAFGSFSSGLAAANPIASDSNLANSGVCTWFRTYNRDGVPVWDGDVTITGGGGDIEFDNVNFIQGGQVDLESLGAVMPM